MLAFPPNTLTLGPQWQQLPIGRNGGSIINRGSSIISLAPTDTPAPTDIQTIGPQGVMPWPSGILCWAMSNPYGSAFVTPIVMPYSGGTNNNPNGILTTTGPSIFTSLGTPAASFSFTRNNVGTTLNVPNPLVLQYYGGNGTAVNSITDDKGGQWAQLTTYTPLYTAQSWLRLGGAAGNIKVTVNLAANDEIVYAQLFEITGSLTPGNPIEQILAPIEGTAQIGAFNNITPNNFGDLVIVMASQFSNTTSFPSNTVYTLFPITDTQNGQVYVSAAVATNTESSYSGAWQWAGNEPFVIQGLVLH